MTAVADIFGYSLPELRRCYSLAFFKGFVEVLLVVEATFQSDARYILIRIYKKKFSVVYSVNLDVFREGGLNYS